MNRNVYYTCDFEVYYFMSPPLFRNENRMKLVEAEHSGKLEKSDLQFSARDNSGTGMDFSLTLPHPQNSISLNQC